MGFLTGKTAIITGAGRAVLSDGSCGSIGYGIATAFAKRGRKSGHHWPQCKKLEEAKNELEARGTASAFCRCRQMCRHRQRSHRAKCRQSGCGYLLVAFRCW